MDTKHCGGCNQDLPVTDFFPKGKGPTGTVYRTRLCRDCHNAKRRADPRERERYNQWREDNAEWWAEYMRKWRAENPGYDTRHLYATGKLRLQIEGECVYCGEPAVEIDHFIPKALGGSDALSNLVPACRSCNASKNATHPSEWNPSKPLWRIFSDSGKVRGSLQPRDNPRQAGASHAAATTE